MLDENPEAQAPPAEETAASPTPKQEQPSAKKAAHDGQISVLIRILAIVALVVYGLGVFSLTYHYFVTTKHFSVYDERVVALAAKHVDKGFSLQDLFKALTGFLAAASTLRLAHGDAVRGRFLNWILWFLIVVVFALSALWSEGMDLIVKKTSAFDDAVYEGIKGYAYDRVRETLILLGSLASGLIGKGKQE